MDVLFANKCTFNVYLALIVSLHCFFVSFYQFMTSTPDEGKNPDRYVSPKLDPPPKRGKNPDRYVFTIAVTPSEGPLRLPMYGHY